MTTETENKPCIKPEQLEQHKWLEKLVGSWTIDYECLMGPDGKPSKSSGKETVRMLGEVWVVAEGEMEGPDGSTGNFIMTLGYDPTKKHFVGTWTGSMLTFQWIYEGDLDSAKTVLPLNTVGPDFHAKEPGKLAKYQDIIEIVDDNHRILKSQVQGEDGKWTQFMTANYTRVNK